MKDSRTIRRIVDAIDPRRGETLLEIGAGAGQLTLPLVERGATVLAVEPDARLTAELRRGPSGIEVVEQDALELDFGALLDERGLDRIRVCGNLPYSMAAPILLRLLSHIGRFNELVLMFQDEVAARLVARPGTKAYGVLSVLSQQAASVSVLFRIPPEAFKPRPRVISALVRFLPRVLDAPEVADERLFRGLVRGLLAHRRKTIANNIKRFRSKELSAKTLAASIEEASIEPGRRAETLTVEEFARISRFCASLR